MPNRISVVFIFLLMTVGFVAIAQDDAPAPERQLTATQLVVDMTETAQVNQTPIPVTATDEQFAQTATALVIFASQTSQANGILGVTQTPSVNYALTATQIIAYATQTGEARIIAQAETVDPENDTMSALSLTLIMLVMMILVLVAISSAFAYMNTRQTPKI